MLEELRDHVVALDAMDRRLSACLADVRATRERTQQELLEVGRQDLQTRPLGAVGTPDGNVCTNIPLEVVRDTVVRMHTFTIGELASELGCSTRKAKLELARVEHLVNPAGRMGGRQIYTYCVPQGPGEAFEAQQRLRATGDLRVSTSQQVKQSLIDMVRDKEVKKAVREAIADGWELEHAGGRHPLRLVRAGHRPIVIVSTPRSSGNAAEAIRRQTRQARSGWERAYDREKDR